MSLALIFGAVVFLVLGTTAGTEYTTAWLLATHPQLTAEPRVTTTSGTDPSGPTPTGNPVPPVTSRHVVLTAHGVKQRTDQRLPPRIAWPNAF